MDHNYPRTRTISGAILPVVHDRQVSICTIEMHPKNGHEFKDYCLDDRARLRWRIAKHPEHQLTWVLRPSSGRLLVQIGSMVYAWEVP